MTDRAKDRMGELVDGVKGSFISIHSAIQEAYELGRKSNSSWLEAKNKEWYEKGRADENEAVCEIISKEAEALRSIELSKAASCIEATISEIRSRLSGTGEGKA